MELSSSVNIDKYNLYNKAHWGSQQFKECKEFWIKPLEKRKILNSRDTKYTSKCKNIIIIHM